jgi:deoxyribodipyrimidine photo-lyase
MASTRALHWFRSDLRVRDNTALRAIVEGCSSLACVFVFDPKLLANAGAPRVRFMLDCVRRLAQDLEQRGSRLLLRRGDPATEIPRLAGELRCGVVAWNRDYGPFARTRDAAVGQRLAASGVRVETYKDRVVFEAEEIRTRAERPYTVYTPYRRAWWQRHRAAPAAPRPAVRLPPPPADAPTGSEPELAVASDTTRIPSGGSAAGERRLDAFLEHAIADYAWQRDLPAVEGTSRLSPHLRIGTISVRTCLSYALDAARGEPRLSQGVAKWADELVWREFYHAILAEHPRVLRGAFRPELASIAWQDDPGGLQAWREGRTGFPFVDAGMRELAATGWMHNRARMVTASFLCKDLLIDWRNGERWFMQRLVDGDPASNNGGWQWAASTGTDAQPYFRIFNPILQGERFDPEGAYARRWLPELSKLPARWIHRPWEAPAQALRDAGVALGVTYPAPIVDHARQRDRAVTMYREAGV